MGHTALGIVLVLSHLVQMINSRLRVNASRKKLENGKLSELVDGVMVGGAAFLNKGDHALA